MPQGGQGASVPSGAYEVSSPANLTKTFAKQTWKTKLDFYHECLFKYSYQNTSLVPIT